MKNMGGLGGLMDKLPNIGGVNLAQMGNAQGAAEKQFKQMEAIINSMTPAERRDPELISGSRKRRIAMGSGTQVQDIGRLIKQHKQMQKMMKKFSAKGRNGKNDARHGRNVARRRHAEDLKNPRRQPCRRFPRGRGTSSKPALGGS